MHQENGIVRHDSGETLAGPLRRTLVSRYDLTFRNIEVKALFCFLDAELTNVGRDSGSAATKSDVIHEINCEWGRKGNARLTEWRNRRADLLAHLLAEDFAATKE